MAAMLFVASVSHGFPDDPVISITNEFLSAQLDVKAEKWWHCVRKSGDTPRPRCHSGEKTCPGELAGYPLN
jgi:hypothetical protein